MGRKGSYRCRIEITEREVGMSGWELNSIPELSASAPGDAVETPSLEVAAFGWVKPWPKGSCVGDCRLKDLQRSLTASASCWELVNLSTEVVKALGRDDFLSHIGCSIVFVAQNYWIVQLLQSWFPPETFISVCLVFLWCTLCFF